MLPLRTASLENMPLTTRTKRLMSNGVSSLYARARGLDPKVTGPSLYSGKSANAAFRPRTRRAVPTPAVGTVWWAGVGRGRMFPPLWGCPPRGLQAAMVLRESWPLHNRQNQNPQTRSARAESVCERRGASWRVRVRPGGPGRIGWRTVRRTAVRGLFFGVVRGSRRRESAFAFRTRLG